MTKEASLSSYSGKKGFRLLEQYRDSQVPASQSKTITTGSAFDERAWMGVNPALDTWHDVVSTMLKLAEGSAEKGSDAGSSSEPSDASLAAFDKLAGIMDDGLVFYPPTYWRHREGKLMGLMILQAAFSVFGTSFRYHRQLADGTGTNVMLEFSAMIDEVPCQGVDIITFDRNAEDAKIVEFKVMVRPPEAALRLKQIMKAKLATAMGQTSKM